MRRGSFRQGGLPHQLLVLADLSRALRDEERQAWQRLIRVLGHELNNSLAPIRSVAGSLEELLAREPRPADWEDDLRRGLAVIAGARRGARALHGRLRAAGPAAAARSAQPVDVAAAGAAGGAARDAGAGGGRAAAPTLDGRGRPATSSSSS